MKKKRTSKIILSIFLTFTLIFWGGFNRATPKRIRNSNPFWKSSRTALAPSKP